MKRDTLIDPVVEKTNKDADIGNNGTGSGQKARSTPAPGI